MACFLSQIVEASLRDRGSGGHLRDGEHLADGANYLFVVVGRGEAALLAALCSAHFRKLRAAVAFEREALTRVVDFDHGLCERVFVFQSDRSRLPKTT